MATSFLYNPNSNYGYQATPGPWGKARNYLGTYLGGLDAETNPQDYFTGWLAKQGFGGTDNNSTMARNLYGRFQDAYGAARLKNNQLRWQDFLRPMDVKSMIGNMSSEQKGIRAADTTPYDVRWIPR